MCGAACYRLIFPTQDIVNGTVSLVAHHSIVVISLDYTDLL